MGLGADWGWTHLVVVSCCFGGRIQVKSLALPLRSLRHSQSAWCTHSLWREAGVLLVVGAFVHSQRALRTHRMVGGRGWFCFVPAESVRERSWWGEVFSLCALFNVCCLLSLVAPLRCRAWRWGARRLLHACSGSMSGCTSVHPSRCARSSLGVVAGALGGDAGSILLEDSMQALLGGPLAWGVAARS